MPKNPTVRRLGAATLVLICCQLVFLGCDNPVQTVKYKALSAVVKLSDADLSPDPAMQASFDPKRDEKAREELGYVIGSQAYLYGIAGLRMEDFRYGMRQLFKLAGRMNPDRISDVGDDGMTFNEYAYLTQLPNANMRFGASPNHDTLYGGIFYKLDQEPLVLTVPGIKDRYVNLQVTDAYFSNDRYIEAGTGCSPCRYLVMGPYWEGSVPQGMTPVRLHTNEGYLAVRILVDGPWEYKLVNQIQGRFKAQPLSEYQRPDTPRHRPLITQPDNSGELAVYRRIVDIARRNPPADPKDLVAWESFQYIGMSLAAPFDPDRIDPAIKRGMERAIDAVHDIVAWKVKSRGYQAKTYWRVDLLGGAYGQNYLRRTESVVQGLFLHDPKEALYFLTYHDKNGDLLNGDGNYTLHFKADQLPPVEAFWSITLYDSAYNFVENDMNRFAIGDRTPGLVYNEDGSLTLYFGSRPPQAGASNWLPAPVGKNFRLTFRMYKPRPVVLDPATLEDYLPPLVKQ